ncbi:MAG: hypothetical protein QM679_04905 [Patulibacter sp.]
MPKYAVNGTIERPDAADDPWVFVSDNGQMVRLGRDAAELALHLSGDECIELGQQWTPPLISETADRLCQAGVLRDGARAPSARRGRLRRIGAMTLQLQVVRDPGRVVAPLARAAARLPRGYWAGGAALCGLAGLVALVLQLGAVDEALSRQLQPNTLAAVFAMLLLTNVAHEIAHGVTLARFGGRPGSMGLLLIYLMPAFYCDVTRAWKLPRRASRVWVAAAGPLMQAGMAGAATLSAINSPEPARSVLLLYACVTYLQAAINCLPFLKFDGYIVLMCSLDRPYLRRDAMAAAGGGLGRRLFGGGAPTRSSGRVMAFGVASILFTFGFVLYGGYALVVALSGVPLLPVLAAGLLLIWATVYVTRLAVRGARSARDAGAPRLRVALGCVVVVAAIAAPWLAIRVAPESSGLWWNGAAGAYVTDMHGAAPATWSGRRVRLLSAGVLPKACGDARVGADRGLATAAYGQMLPVRIDARAQVQAAPLADTATPCTGGRAVVQMPDVALYRAAWRYVVAQVS